MFSALPGQTPSLFDLIEEPIAVATPEPKIEIPVEFTDPGPNVSTAIAPPSPCVLAPQRTRDCAGDPLRRRYESGASFVEFVGERSPRGWRAALSLKIDGVCETAEALSLSSLHKTLGDALGTVRHHAMERLRTEAAKTYGSFPPPTGTKPDEATSLYWALGREDFRALPDPEVTTAAVAPLIVEPTPEAEPITEATEPKAREMIVGLDFADPTGSYTVEALDWRVPGALARVRLFHPRLDAGEVWTWSVEWSTGSSSEVEAIRAAKSRQECVSLGRSLLLATFSRIATKGEAYTSRMAEYERTCALYRLILRNGEPIDASGEEPMKEAA